jgi:flagellar capping protein FliD
MPDYDTQPTLETILTETQKGFAAVAEAMKTFREEVTAQFNEVFRRLDMIDAKIDTLNDRLLTLDARVRLHDKRISELESRL